MRRAAPRCGAKAKSTGEPCRALALANGRCNAHGGKTPKGDKWHRVQIDRAKTPTAVTKIDRKLSKREAEAKVCQRRIERMTPKQRERYEAWQRSHQPGSTGKRAAARIEREQSDWFRGIVERVDRDRDDKPEVDVFG